MSIRSSDRDPVPLLSRLRDRSRTRVGATVARLKRKVRQARGDRPELAAQLAESEALYRSTVDSLVDGVVIQDDEGRILRMNVAARQVLADNLRSPIPSAGDNFGDSLPTQFDSTGAPLAPEDRPAMKALATGAPVVGMVVGLDLLDGRRWFRCNANPIHDSQNTRRGVVLSFSDITEERRMSSELADQQRRFRLALENAPIGMALVAADGHFMEVNQALCELTGRNRETLLASTFQEITHPEDLDADLNHVQRLLEGRADSYRMEKRYLTPDGEIVHVLLAVAAVRSSEAGDPYFIAQVVDIGERKRTEEAQRAALDRERELVAQLTELDRTKTQFVSNVSHELRTPLTSAIGYLELLREGTAGDLSERQTEMVGVAERNSRRLLGLIEDLLSVSRIESGQRRTPQELVEVEALVGTVVTMLEPMAVKRSIEVAAGTDPGCGPILANPSQLERVLLNVVDNAIKFTPPGGLVTVEAGPGPDPAHAEIRVADTGIGIPEADQEQIFARFFRSASAYSNSVPGTGLGLAIAAELVAAQGGSISLESEEHVGTVVTISLPVARQCDGQGRVGASAASPQD